MNEKISFKMGVNFAVLYGYTFLDILYEIRGEDKPN